MELCFHDITHLVLTTDQYQRVTVVVSIINLTVDETLQQSRFRHRCCLLKYKDSR